MSEVEQKADYAELRRLYFSHPEKDKTPSHSIESNFESELDEPLETPSSRLHEVMTSTLDANEMFSSIGQDEVNEFTTQLSQRSNDIIHALHDKYGARTYSKITQMIKSEDFSEWEQLEQELLSVQVESLVEESSDAKLEPSGLSLFEDSFEELALDADADLDYLDALVQHDYGRLRKLQSDSECISSIFSEIIENEQKSSSNYQDDVFNKNIELIFNSDVDLDDCEWEEFERPMIQPLTTDLNETIDQLKQNTQSLETEKVIAVEHKQASLEVFYSEQKKEQLAVDEATMMDEVVTQPIKYNKVNALNMYILMTGIVVLAIIIYLVLQSK